MRLSIAEICLIFIAGLLAGSRFLEWGRKRYGLESKPAFCAAFGLAGSFVCLLIFENRGMSLEGLFYSLCVFVLLLIGMVDEKTFEIPVELNLFICILGGIRLLTDSLLAGIWGRDGGSQRPAFATCFYDKGERNRRR